MYRNRISRKLEEGTCCVHGPRPPRPRITPGLSAWAVWAVRPGPHLPVIGWQYYVKGCGSGVYGRFRAVEADNALLFGMTREWRAAHYRMQRPVNSFTRSLKCQGNLSVVSTRSNPKSLAHLHLHRSRLGYVRHGELRSDNDRAFTWLAGRYASNPSARFWQAGTLPAGKDLVGIVGCALGKARGDTA